MDDVINASKGLVKVTISYNQKAIMQIAGKVLSEESVYFQDVADINYHISETSKV